MPYWGSGPTENDYAFDAVGAYVFMVKERMFQDMTTVLDRSYPEQGIVASIQCLRVLAEEFPKCVSIHFRKKDFNKAKAGFDAWYEAVRDKLPSEHRDAIYAAAYAEFALFEERVLHTAE